LDGRKMEAKIPYNKIIIVVSLLVNIILATEAVVLHFENKNLEGQISVLVYQNENLTRRLHVLLRDYNLTVNQLAYYKSQAEYFSKLLSARSATEGLVGNATVNIVAVRTVERGPFEAYYEGVTMKATVELRRGSGKILVNTQPRVGISLQDSVRTASMVAENFTGIELGRTDILVTVISEGEVDVVDGPSAGAAITVAIIASVKGEFINESVFITGTINPDGTIGQVGGIPEKALAAAKMGAREFLVPRGQSIITIWKEERTKIGPLIIINYKPYNIDLKEYLRQQGYNVKVIEVEKISEAYELMVIV
jgi:uncharacterized protein